MQKYLIILLQNINFIELIRFTRNHKCILLSIINVQRYKSGFRYKCCNKKNCRWWFSGSVYWYYVHGYEFESLQQSELSVKEYIQKKISHGCSDWLSTKLKMITYRLIPMSVFRQQRLETSPTTRLSLSTILSETFTSHQVRLWPKHQIYKT